jgi:hypothetical protein
MKSFFLALPLVALMACNKNSASKDSKDLLMSSDIDSLVGWLPNPNALTKGKAHSGHYALGVDDTHEFSPGYSNIMGQLSSTRLRGIRLSAWAYATDKNSKAKLEFVVKSADGTEIFRDQTLLGEVKDFSKWVKINKEITLPAAATYASQIVIYVSRAEATTPAYIDDIQMTALH